MRQPQTNALLFCRLMVKHGGHHYPTRETLSSLGLLFSHGIDETCIQYHTLLLPDPGKNRQRTPIKVLVNSRPMSKSHLMIHLEALLSSSMKTCPVSFQVSVDVTPRDEGCTRQSSCLVHFLVPS